MLMRFRDNQPKLLVSDAIGCALPRGVTWDGFQGQGILTTGWPGAAADALSRKEAIHTCLIARMNAFGDDVPIFLSGPSVTQRPSLGRDDSAQYPYHEAVWLASIDSPQAKVQIHVWPFKDTLQVHCVNKCTSPSFDPTPIARRVCGNVQPDICGLFVHGPPGATDPSGAECRSDATTEGAWKCRINSTASFKPAIQTRLGPCGWRVIYGDTCTEPAHKPARDAEGYCLDHFQP